MKFRMSDSFEKVGQVVNGALFKEIVIDFVKCITLLNKIEIVTSVEDSHFFSSFSSRWINVYFLHLYNSAREISSNLIAKSILSSIFPIPFRFSHCTNQFRKTVNFLHQNIVFKNHWILIIYYLLLPLLTGSIWNYIQSSIQSIRLNDSQPKKNLFHL